MNSFYDRYAERERGVAGLLATGRAATASRSMP